MLQPCIYARDSDREPCLGYTQALRPGVKASFGLALDTQKLNDANPIGPSHKVGVNFVFDS